MTQQRKLNENTQARIMQAIRVGATYDLAAMYGGISYQTLRNWIKRGEAEAERRQNPRVKPDTEQWKKEQDFVKFIDALRDAEGDAAIKWLAMIDKAAIEQWQAAAWKLERRYPKDYGRTVVDNRHTGPDGDAIRFLVEHINARHDDGSD